MNYTEFNVGNETYKLRLTTRTLVALEKQLNCNPIQIFYDIDNNVLPKLSDMAIILNAMLQTLQHGINIDKTYEIIDNYLADGNNMFDLVPMFVEVFQDSGFINATVETTEVSDPN